ncbi:N-acyl homoserine lactonase family protein [Candidimonas humi]|jgi:glyoxylase-like metal-dependent hydrolase (beta-lactamase superfamily II)|uniref:N-acyl homoserine lactonase family protein n=1 Tax=Candidimonas humi TaxID=683355 RepID=A0ABV8P139_9BURK|nr:N-acyl homoserine lactonase family protein [Candidimonas humi]MBV6305691.1 N-acyl homoserine lactonase family protein [Candidimonas humi]
MQTTPLPEYEIYALRFARMQRHTSENFIFRDEHDGLVDMDFFIWLVRNGDTAILVDTGFGERSAQARKRPLDLCPIDALRHLGVDPADIRDVVITHLHWDHAGNLDKLPNATFHIQDTEAAYATGRCMCQPSLRRAFAVEDVCDFVHRVYEERVCFHDGDDTLAPGVELLHVGGHTKGLQAVRVNTARGWVVLASDAAHYYANLTRRIPFPVVVDVEAMLTGHARLVKSASSPDHFIPGHDPLVLTRYPRVENVPVDIVSLHLDPAPMPAQTA